MARQYSLAHLSVLQCPPPEMTYIAARAGYDFVSYRLIYMGMPGEPDYSLHQNKTLFKQTKTALADTGVKLLDIELARVVKDASPMQYLPAMEVAAELGGKHVLTSVWTEDWDYSVDFLATLCDLALPLGLTVDLEYVPIAAVKNLEQAVALLQEVNKPNTGLMIDTHHFHRAKDAVADLSKLPRHWFHFMHLCDACPEIPESKEEMTRIMREERLYIGEGGIHIADIIRAMPDVPCSMELPNSARSGELGWAEHAARSLESAKRYFNEHSLQ